MAKSSKFCQDCEFVHNVGDCGKETPEDRRKDHKRRERVKQAELHFDFSDPMLLDP